MQMNRRSRCGGQATWGPRRSGRRPPFPGSSWQVSSRPRRRRPARTRRVLRRPRPRRPGSSPTTDVDAVLARLRRRRLHGLRRHPARRGDRRHRALPARGHARRHPLAVLALRPALGAAGMGRAADRGRGGGRCHAARQRGRPGLGQRRARGDRSRALHQDQDHPLPGDLRLLDLQPAVRGQGVVWLRRLDGRNPDDAAAVGPDHGVGRQHPAHRPRPRPGDRRDHRGGRAPPARRVGRHRDGPRSRRAPRVRSGSRSSAGRVAANGSSSTTSPGSTRPARRTGPSPTRASATTGSSSTATRS